MVAIFGRARFVDVFLFPRTYDGDVSSIDVLFLRCLRKGSALECLLKVCCDGSRSNSVGSPVWVLSVFWLLLLLSALNHDISF